jgi:hypothetical protein
MLSFARSLAVALMLASLAGCATPTDSFDHHARNAGLTAGKIMGAPFEHMVFWNAPALAMKEGHGRKDTPLHVYIDGDGTPWRAGHPTADPTPRNPLTLRLIGLDRAPSVLLGRPCFDGLADSAHCNWNYWNDARYSEPVVESMTAALRRLKDEAHAKKVILFGTSGGGALAVLVADRVNFVDGIITVAANLDTKAWLAYHAYNGMKQSLNPAVAGRIHEAEHENVFERHYAGGRDTDVPPETVVKGLRSPSDLIVIPDYNHNCCWADIWPQVLADVAHLAHEPPPVAEAAAPSGS